MTTIDHQQAAIEAMTVDFRPSPYLNSDQNDEQRSAYWVAMRDKLAAATPHLRAAWEQPIRELCEAAIKRANDPLAARGFWGEPFPATVYAQDILDLLEGGGACCEHSKCPGGSICCCQESGGE